MEMAHAHLRTLDWVLQQEPYPGSDAQSSIDREEEMSRVRQVEMEMDVDMESEEEVSCAFAIKDNHVPARSLESKIGKVAAQPPLSPRRTRSGAVLSPKSSRVRYVLKIHFFIELGLNMIQFKIQFKTKSGIFVQKKYSFNRVRNIQ